MTQIPPAYKDVNNTASSLLWLTEPVLSFWLASLSFISGLLNITSKKIETDTTIQYLEHEH